MRPTFIISLEIIAKCHYGNQEVCRVPGALGKAKKTLGKGFAECRHSANDTRRILVSKQTLRVFFVGHSAKTSPSAEKTLGKDLYSAK